MRRLTAALIAMAFLWCAWWWGATTFIAWQTGEWLEARRAEGWRAEAVITTAGFPTRLQVRMSDLNLADPDGGTAVAVETFVLDAPAWWPGNATLHFPESPIAIALNGQPLTLRMSGAATGMRLAPLTALNLEEVFAVSSGWSLAGSGVPLVAAEDFMFRVNHLSEARDIYRVNVTFGNLRPAPAFLDPLNLPADWPETFQSLRAELRVAFDRPFDRSVLHEQLPQPRRAEISGLRILWGPLDIRGEGAVDIAPDGTPEGSLRLRMANWRPVMDAIVTSGLVAGGTGTQVQLFMGALANQVGDGADLDLRLTFEEGQMALGPIALGPAPRLVLHRRPAQRQ